MRAVVLLVTACGGAAAPAPAAPAANQRIDTAEITAPIPAGYKDISASMHAQLPDVVAGLQGPAFKGGEQPVIVLQKAAVAGGTIDAAACAERGRHLVEDGPQLPGKPAKLRGTTVITWTGGKGCEYDYLTPDGIPTQMTELHEPNSDANHPADIWTVTCQHDDGDDAATAACRSVRSGFAKK